MATDDLDADSLGPSLCNPTEPDEKGVFRAIRRVYRSLYNDNAFLERLRHGVNERSVRTALEALFWVIALLGFFYLIWRPPGG